MVATLVSVPALAQSSNDRRPAGGPSTPAAVFQTDTDLVQVDVVVRRDGKPVLDLEAADFELYDNSKLQEIAVFALRREERANEIPPPPPGIITNWPPRSGQEPVSGTVILIDRLNTEFQDQYSVRRQVIEFLKTIEGFEPIAVYSLNETLSVVQPFSTDPQKILAAVELAIGETSFSLASYQEDDSFRENFSKVSIRNMKAVQFNTQENTRKRRSIGTGAALTVIADQLRSLPGRKKLLWISAAPAAVFTMEVPRRQDNVFIERQDMTKELDESARMLNRANVALYAIDPRGPNVDLADQGITTMLRLTEMTGGRAQYASNGLAGEMREAIYDTDVTYTLGYYPKSTENRDARDDADDDPAAYHALEVKVTKPGVQVRHRKGYFQQSIPVIEDEDDRDERLAMWMGADLDAVDLPLIVRAQPVADHPEQRQIQVAVDLSEVDLALNDDRWIGSLDFAIVRKGAQKPVHSETYDLSLREETYQKYLSNPIVLEASVTVLDKNGEPAGRPYSHHRHGRQNGPCRVSLAADSLNTVK